jgi:hypothetical protein
LIPIHPELRVALFAWQKSSKSADAVIASERGGGMTAISIVNWFANPHEAI